MPGQGGQYVSHHSLRRPRNVVHEPPHKIDHDYQDYRHHQQHLEHYSLPLLRIPSTVPSFWKTFGWPHRRK